MLRRRVFVRHPTLCPTLNWPARNASVPVPLVLLVTTEKSVVIFSLKALHAATVSKMDLIVRCTDAQLGCKTTVVPLIRDLYD